MNYINTYYLITFINKALITENFLHLIELVQQEEHLIISRCLILRSFLPLASFHQIGGFHTLNLLLKLISLGFFLNLALDAVFSHFVSGLTENEELEQTVNVELISKLFDELN